MSAPLDLHPSPESGINTITVGAKARPGVVPGQGTLLPGVAFAPMYHIPN
jgi:hypothetical protein